MDKRDDEAYVIASRPKGVNQEQRWVELYLRKGQSRKTYFDVEGRRFGEVHVRGFQFSDGYRR